MYGLVSLIDNRIMDGNGFTVVTSKHNKHRRNIKKHFVKPDEKLAIILDDVELGDVVECIRRIRDSVKGSLFLEDFRDILNSTNTSVKIEDIISYGIGSISQCKIAQHQFALMLISMDILQVSEDRVSLYDPCFTKTDEEIISRFNLKTIKSNEEGKRQVRTKGTLFYMPHCGRPLYDNVLRSNWQKDNMESLMIIGNSFQTIVNNITDKNLLEKYPSIYKVHPYMDEYPLPDSYERKDVFNDTSLHTFSRDKFKLCPDINSFWEIPKEVEYGEDQEIIRSTDHCRN